MAMEIDLNFIVEKSISLFLLLTCFFVGMRILYGYWPWQSGPKRRDVKVGEFGPHEFRPLSEIERERVFESKTDSGAVAAVFLQPIKVSVDEGSASTGPS
jgi:hypothetical protein